MLTFQSILILSLCFLALFYTFDLLIFLHLQKRCVLAYIIFEIVGKKTHQFE